MSERALFSVIIIPFRSARPEDAARTISADRRRAKARPHAQSGRKVVSAF
jgi:hypothetical protein